MKISIIIHKTIAMVELMISAQQIYDAEEGTPAVIFSKPKKKRTREFLDKVL